ncbi:MAG: hypothetical protein O3C40_01725 [Planctomycetota bacterium]|nr:hypothetical protein [Planctomycetota bacterium]
MNASETASPYLLRIEGVNLSYFIFDTDDLSTIRGGSLLLLFAPALVQDDAIWKQLANDAPAAEIVTSGASQTILRFSAKSQAAADAVAREVRTWLQCHEELGEATFVVEVRQDHDDFAVDKEYLLAASRWQQMQRPRLVVPPWNEQAGKEQHPCDIDFVRPATHTIDARNLNKREVSRSVSTRREYGFVHKQELYYKLTGWKPRDREGTESQLAWDFHEIAARGEHRYGRADDNDGDPLAHLHDKMAVLYIDGNRFGDIQRSSCHDSARQRAWDEHVQGLRKKVLKSLLEKTDDDDEWICKLGTPKQGKPQQIAIRLETLLWGGDELTWVVPAWKGWEVVQTFFQVAAAWPQWQQNDKDSLQLTHAAGLVFCHASSPIHGVTALARELAGQVKQWNKDQSQGELSRYQDGIAYQVLESFDQLGDEVAKARKRDLPAGCSPADLVIPATELTALTSDLLKPIQTGFPRGAVYRLLKSLQRGKTDEYWRWLERAMRDHPVLPESFGTSQDNDDLPPSPAQQIRWLHLCELWDYIGHLDPSTLAAE